MSGALPAGALSAGAHDPARSASSAEPSLRCLDLVAGYGSTTVVRDVTIDVGAGEVVALLGPSGSGKTTLLSAVAGFLRTQGGEIRIDGVVVAGPGRHIPPERRGVAVVFQQSALWPHMTAVETVAYPIRRRGVDRREAHRAASDLLDRLGIGHLGGRRPAELSGGEQQRVGLGRALAREARLYLFDEPTAHLDASLRVRLQGEIAEQRRRVGAAALYATHDTTEALALADRVALMRDGRLVQLGSPATVYERPVDLWAARLTGPASVLGVAVLGRRANRLRVSIAGVEAEVIAAEANGDGGDTDERDALVRPDWARLGGDLPGRVTGVAYRGTHTDYDLDTPVGTVGIREAGTPRAARGEATGWRLDRVWLLDSAPLADS